MKNLSRSALFAAAALVSMAAAPAFAAGQAAYQCTVLGDNSACASAPQEALDGATAYQHFLSGTVAAAGKQSAAVEGYAAYQRLFGVSPASSSRTMRANRSGSAS